MLAVQATLVASDAPDLAGLWAGPGRLPEPIAGCGAALVYSRSASLLARLQAVPRVVARDPQPPPGAGHAASWYAGALEALGVAHTMRETPILSPAPDERAAADEVSHRLPPGFLALHPGSGSPSKNWPADCFAALSHALAARQPFVVVEGPADGDAAARLRELRPRAVPATELPLRVLGAILSRAGLYVGNDSGVSHLAAAFGARTLTLFGPTDPAVWAPLGPSASVLRATGGDLAGLAVDSVVEAARRASSLP